MFLTHVSSTRVIDTPEGQFTISFTPKERETVIDRSTPQPFGNGFLSVEQANLILNHLPLEITFVNKDEIFQYYNDDTPAEEMVFKRTPSQVGRNVELCHPPKVLDKVKKIFALLRNGERDKVSMWFRSEKMVNLSMSPMQQFVMINMSLRVCLNTSKIFKNFWI